MASIRHQEWRDEFESTNYPFGDKALLVNQTGDTLLEGTFLDAHLYPIGGKEGIYLSQVNITFAAVTVTIGDKYNASLASGSFKLTQPPSLIKLTDSYGRPAGVLVSEPTRLAVIQSWGIGLHTFDASQTEFAVTCCMPTPEIGVRGIILSDGSLLTGPVWLLGDDGVVVSHEEITLPGQLNKPPEVVSVIRIDVVGDPLYRRRLCDPQTLFSTPNPVRKIRVVNGNTSYLCTPSHGGNFTIQMNDNLAADTALRVHQTPTGLVLEVAGSLSTAVSAQS